MSCRNCSECFCACLNIRPVWYFSCASKDTKFCCSIVANKGWLYIGSLYADKFSRRTISADWRFQKFCRNSFRGSRIPLYTNTVFRNFLELNFRGLIQFVKNAKLCVSKIWRYLIGCSVLLKSIDWRYLIGCSVLLKSIDWHYLIGCSVLLKSIDWRYLIGCSVLLKSIVFDRLFCITEIH